MENKTSQIIEIINLQSVTDLGIRDSVNHKGREYRRLSCIAEDGTEYRLNTSTDINSLLLDSLGRLELPIIGKEQGKSFGNNKKIYFEAILPEEMRDNIFKKILFKK